MNFEKGKCNLRDIRKFMTSVEDLRSVVNTELKKSTKAIIKKHIVKTFNKRSTEVKVEKRLVR